MFPSPKKKKKLFFSKNRVYLFDNVVKISGKLVADEEADCTAEGLEGEEDEGEGALLHGAEDDEHDVEEREVDTTLVSVGW